MDSTNKLDKAAGTLSKILSIWFSMKKRLDGGLNRSTIFRFQFNHLTLDLILTLTFKFISCIYTEEAVSGV